MDDIVEAIGISATLSLVHVYAGTKIYVPIADNLAENHPLSELLGLQLARRLCAVIGGSQIAIPVCDRMLADRRADEVIRRLEGGESVATVATSYSLSERAVYAIIAAARDG